MVFYNIYIVSLFCSQMGMMCMLSSMKAPPWDLEQYQTLDQRTHLRLRTWYNAACARTSIAGAVYNI